MINIDKLKQTLSDQKPYRFKQAFAAVFKDLVSDWNEVTNLSLDLRKRLEKGCPLSINVGEVLKDKGTIKAKIILDDDLAIETVLMKYTDKRNTICVSSQVGCPLGCLFCATGLMGFKRNLKSYEIVNQVLFFARILKQEKEKIDNVVFMGMGEPFLNYGEVMEAIRILNDKDGLNIGIRHISISTVGIEKGIRDFANENLQINLAISLHAPNDKLRTSLMPANIRLEKLFKAIDYYIEKTNRKVMFEYLLINGVNDTKECAQELASLMKKPLYFLNLIEYNPTRTKFKPSSEKNKKIFKEILLKNRIQFTERYRFGQNIKAACGQLIVE
jgi:23S rRNA (adenine2503-C2)-methyltransferase